MAGVFTSSFKTIGHLIMNISKKQSDRKWNPHWTNGHIVYLKHLSLLYCLFLPPLWRIATKAWCQCQAAQHLWFLLHKRCSVGLCRTFQLCLPGKKYIFLIKKTETILSFVNFFLNSFSISRLSIIRTDHILLTRDSSWSVNWNQYFIPKI